MGKSRPSLPLYIVYAEGRLSEIMARNVTLADMLFISFYQNGMIENCNEFITSVDEFRMIYDVQITTAKFDDSMLESFMDAENFNLFIGELFGFDGFLILDNM